MVELAAGKALEAAAWKMKNLEDYEERLERAARRVDQMAKDHEKAALVIYEAALMKSGRPVEEVRRLVRMFEETFEDEEEELTIPRASGIMNIEGDEWFFGDRGLRSLVGQLLGQFQHRVAQYNYIDEREVLRRWADSYDTRLFIRRRIYETEPFAGVVSGVDLPLVQYLRVIAGGDTVVSSEELSRALVALDILDEEAQSDDYAVIAVAENLALHLELPAPIVGEMLNELAVENRLEFPEPPPEVAGITEPEEATEGDEYATGGTDRDSVKPSPSDIDARHSTRRRADRGEEPTRVQDPQAKDAPAVPEEEGEKPIPSPPEAPPQQQAPGTEGEGS